MVSLLSNFYSVPLSLLSLSQAVSRARNTRLTPRTALHPAAHPNAPFLHSFTKLFVYLLVCFLRNYT